MPSCQRSPGTVIGGASASDLRDPVGIVVGLGGAEDKAVDLRRVETDDLDIEVELDLAERLHLYRQQFLVPTGQLGQAVVGDDVCLDLCFGEVAQPNCRDLFEPIAHAKVESGAATGDAATGVSEEMAELVSAVDRFVSNLELVFDHEEEFTASADSRIMTVLQTK